MLNILFIGAHNEIGDPQRELIQQWADRYLDGYTMLSASGHWQGKSEASTVILYHGHSITNYEIGVLKQAIAQDCIMVMQTEVQVREV